MDSLKRKHEGLANYISQITAPATLSAPTARPRFEVAPGGKIPEGRRPIPTSSERPKPTNVQIPYVRQASGVPGALGRVVNPTEGDIVFVQRKEMWHRIRRIVPNRPAYFNAYSIEQINEKEFMTRERAGTAPMPLGEFDYDLDGVVNNVDWPDPEHEFRDVALLNVCIQGPVRLEHAPERRCTLKTPSPSSIVYVGLFAIKVKAKTALSGATPSVSGEKTIHKLIRFSSCRLLNDRAHPDKLDFFKALVVESDPDRLAPMSDGGLLKAWQVGRVVDTKQSNNLLMIHVSVAPINAIDAAEATEDQKDAKTLTPYYCMPKELDLTKAFKDGDARNAFKAKFLIESRSTVKYFKDRYDK